MKNLNIKRETLLSILSFTINLTCFVFVMWQIVNCATRYFQKPRGTTTSYEKTTDLLFPAITVCGSNFYNENGLKKCGVQKDKYYNGNWNGNDCADPQTTFETIAYKLEDLVAAVSYKFFKEDNEYFENDPKLLKKFWSQTDSLKYGRCFTLVPTSEHIKLGIQKITIRVSSDLKLFFHTPGIFITTRKETEVMEMQSVSLGYSYDIGIQHDLFNIINDESICTAHSKYSKDQCANKEVDKKSLEYFGCTSPYGPNKTQICQNPDIGLNVTKLYEDTIEKHNSICLNPCSFLSIKVTKSKETFFTAYKSEKKSYIQIVFRETVKVTTGYYLYNGLTLFAQIGGYIGLGRTIVWAYDKTVAFVEQSKLIFSKHQQKSMIA